MKKIIKFLFSRFTITTLIILLQVYLIIYGMVYYNSILKWMPVLTVIIEIALIIDVVSRDMPADLKLPWIAVISLVPLAGIIIYTIFSRNVAGKRYTKIADDIFVTCQNTIDEYQVSSEIVEKYKDQSNYIKNTCNCGLFTETSTKYFSCGEDFFLEYVEDLKTAKSFIFLEYFIIENGKMFDTILEVLKSKVEEGVEVRLMYDDIGTIGKIPANYNKYLKSLGINCIKFRPFLPFVSAIHNNRNHRKITVIDGVIGYVGGINLADEYINEVNKFGYWKDSTVKLVGDATRQLTVMFLQNFSLQKLKKEDYEKYTKVSFDKVESSGYVQPFCDGPSPLYKELICENVYLNMINQAKKTIFITTPYLVIDSLLKNALTTAVKRGVDVRIVTPNTPDKLIIFCLTRANYLDLLKNGVKIYEYKPGFIHTKNILVDEEIAVVGTINLDYRSLIHHYECGVWMYNTDAINEIKQDFDNIFKVSSCIDKNKFKLKWYENLIYKIIGIFSPLM